jgi:hypothetical protein
MNKLLFKTLEEIAEPFLKTLVKQAVSHFATTAATSLAQHGTAYLFEKLKGEPVEVEEEIEEADEYDDIPF